MLVETKARVGVFAIALGAYLPQFPTLVPEFEGQYAAFKKTIPDTVEVIDGGIVTTKEQSMAAGDKFRAADVDLVILQLLTYATSYNMLPAVRDLDVPIVLVNVQKKKAPDYANTDTPTWLGELYACGAVGEMVADLERAGKRHAVITGVVEGGDPGVQAEIEDWCRAAQVRRRFRDTNLAQIGRPYPGMMDLYIDETNLYNRMWLYTKQFDWEKMWAIADNITDEEAIRAKAQDILDTFDIEGGGTMNKNLLSEGRDFYQAVTGSTGSGMVTFRTADGEHVMAVTSLVPYAAGNVTAMRLVTSLTLVDRQWYSTLMVSFGVAAVVLGFAVFSGLFFIRTIVRPLGQVEATANRIAHGDLTTRLPDAPYDDEIGRLCKAINQMAEDLTKTERMKNEFISSVSHELRTPLTSIKGWVETIANIRDPDDENYRKGITIIRSETDRLYNMVEELLDFSRLQNGIKLNCEVLDFVAEATDAALFVEARIRQEGLHLVYDEPPEPYPVWADPARLRQVFVNVFDNAIKYSPPEGTIFFTLTRTATTVTASIRDQGRGIAPDDLQNVKMKFFKAKNAVRGSGIGLAVVDEITKALGGTADITSTLGQGTTVTITMPIYHAGQEHLHEPI